jgi:plasmid stabilization system protein ParE
VAQVVYTRRALDDLAARFRFLAKESAAAALDALHAIQGAVTTLEDHPLIGRAVDGNLRELVISFGHTGYIALYRFLPAQNLVRVLSVRHQRELGRGL